MSVMVGFQTSPNNLLWAISISTIKKKLIAGVLNAVSHPRASIL